ncbi:rhodanese superfamily protein [Bordetella pertussis]|nr:rhodanese superfamily protein [Bordetella pertussis]
MAEAGIEHVYQLEGGIRCEKAAIYMAEAGITSSKAAS